MKSGLMIWISIVLLVVTIDAKPNRGPIDIKAQLFEFDSNSQNFTATGKVKIKQDNVYLTGGKTVYKQKTQQIIMKGNVNIKKGPLFMTARHVVADINQNIVTAFGEVEIRYRDYIGKAQKASFNIEKMKVLLNSASINQGRDSLKADSIFLDMKNNQITSKGNTQIKTMPDTQSTIKAPKKDIQKRD